MDGWMDIMMGGYDDDGEGMDGEGMNDEGWMRGWIK